MKISNDLLANQANKKIQGCVAELKPAPANVQQFTSTSISSIPAHSVDLLIVNLITPTQIDIVTLLNAARGMLSENGVMMFVVLDHASKMLVGDEIKIDDESLRDHLDEFYVLQQKFPLLFLAHSNAYINCEIYITFLDQNIFQLNDKLFSLAIENAGIDGYVTVHDDNAYEPHEVADEFEEDDVEERDDEHEQVEQRDEVGQESVEGEQEDKSEDKAEVKESVEKSEDEVEHVDAGIEPVEGSEKVEVNEFENIEGDEVSEKNDVDGENESEEGDVEDEEHEELEEPKEEEVSESLDDLEQEMEENKAHLEAHAEVMHEHLASTKNILSQLSRGSLHQVTQQAIKYESALKDYQVLHEKHRDLVSGFLSAHEKVFAKQAPVRGDYKKLIDAHKGVIAEHDEKIGEHVEVLEGLKGMEFDE